MAWQTRRISPGRGRGARGGGGGGVVGMAAAPNPPPPPPPPPRRRATAVLRLGIILSQGSFFAAPLYTILRGAGVADWHASPGDDSRPDT